MSIILVDAKRWHLRAALIRNLRLDLPDGRLSLPRHERIVEKRGLDVRDGVITALVGIRIRTMQ